jgi:hypothetical protein
VNRLNEHRANSLRRAAALAFVAAACGARRGEMGNSPEIEILVFAQANTRQILVLAKLGQPTPVLRYWLVVRSELDV